MKKIGCILGVWLLVLVQVTAFAESAPAAVREASKSVVRVISETDSGTAFGTGFAIGETSLISLPIIMLSTAQRECLFFYREII
mgnify:CR=1 FL=1